MRDAAVIFDGSCDQLELRQIYTQIMDQLMEADERVVAGDADVGFSVYGDRLQHMRQKYGDRFFDVGIQEANLAGAAAGLSLVGYIPYIAIFAPFITRRAYDTVFISLAYARLGAKLIGCDPGYTSAYNGGSHSALEDTGIMRCIPGITIVDVTDSQMLRWVLEERGDPRKLWYIRMPRGVRMKRVYDEKTVFTPGEALTLRQGKDVTLLACGLMVPKALEAAEVLSRSGISARVVDPVTIKPLDEAGIVQCAEETGAIVCCDNHRAVGGLCSAAAEVLAAAGIPCAFEKVAVGERFGEVGSADMLSTKYGLDVEDIIRAAQNAVRRRSL